MYGVWFIIAGLVNFRYFPASEIKFSLEIVLRMKNDDSISVFGSDIGKEVDYPRRSLCKYLHGFFTSEWNLKITVRVKQKTEHVEFTQYVIFYVLIKKFINFDFCSRNIRSNSKLTVF